MLPWAERLRFFNRMCEAFSNNRHSTGTTHANSLRKLMNYNSYNGVGMLGSQSSTPASYHSANSPIVNTPASTRFYTPRSDDFDSTGSVTDSNQSSPLERHKVHDEELYEVESTVEEHVVRPSILKQLSRTYSVQNDCSNTAELLEISAAISSPARDSSSAYCHKTNNKRLKLKTVGKLLLPATFMACNNDRNNNCQNYNNNNNNNNNNNFNNKQQLPIKNENENENEVKKRTIGKIKSIFIDGCQQAEKLKQLNSQEAVNELVLRRKPLDGNSKYRATSYQGTEAASVEHVTKTPKFAKIITNKLEDIENTPANNITPSLIKTRMLETVNSKLLRARSLVQRESATPTNSLESQYAKYFGIKQQQQQKGQRQTQTQNNKKPAVLAYKRGIVLDKDLQLTAQDLAEADKNFNDLLMDLRIRPQDIAEADKNIMFSH